MIRPLTSILLLFVLFGCPDPIVAFQEKVEPTDKQVERKVDLKKLVHRCGAWNKSHQDRISAFKELAFHAFKYPTKDEKSNELSSSAMKGLMHTRLAPHNDYDDQIIAEILQTNPKTALAHFAVFQKSDHPVVRRMGIEIIACLGKNTPKQQVTLLGKMLRSKDPEANWNALFVVKFLGEKCKNLEKDILPFLNSSDLQTRYAALRAAGSLGPETKNAFDEILELTKDETPITVRTIAFIQLAKAAKGNRQHEEKAAEVLLTKLDSRYYMVKQRALEGLAILGKKAAAGKETFRKIMTSSKNGLAPFAAYCYGLSTESYSQANKILIDRLSDYTDSGQCLIFIQKLAPFSRNLLPEIFKFTQASPEEISELHVNALHSLLLASENEKNLDADQTQLHKKVWAYFKVIAEDDVDVVSHLCRRILADRQKTK